MNTTSSPTRSDQESYPSNSGTALPTGPSVWSLIKTLRRVLKSSGVGTFDEARQSASTETFPIVSSCMGPDAGQLFACGGPRLKHVSFLQEARAGDLLQWGPVFPRSARRQRIVRLGSKHVNPNRKRQRGGALTASRSSRTRL